MLAPAETTNIPPNEAEEVPNEGAATEAGVDEESPTTAKQPSPIASTSNQATSVPSLQDQTKSSVSFPKAASEPITSSGLPSRPRVSLLVAKEK